MRENCFVKNNKDNDWIDDYWKIVKSNWQNPLTAYATGGFIPTYKYPKVKKVIYNFKNSEKPTTIVFWDDGTKTVVKCDKETFNKESGLAQAYLKKILGSRGNIQRLIENADIQE